MKVEGYDSQLPSSGRPKVLTWSVLVGLVAGLFGVSAPTALFGTYMEPPPPLLGQPFGYQAIQACGKLVCAPVALNNLALALADYAIFFMVGFWVTFAAETIFGARGKQRSRFRRNLGPLTFFIIALLIVALTAGGSIASGASLTQPHWSTPSGVEVYILPNATLYSGTATTASLQGAAHLDISLVNYYWKSESMPANITLTNGNGTEISSVYQCQSASSCTPLTTIEIKPYSITTFDLPTTAFYFGSAVAKGQNYSLVVATPVFTMNFGPMVAQ